MDTIRAISQMAAEEVGHSAGERTAGAVHLNRLSPGMQTPVLQAVDVLSKSGMHPEADRATQTRLANAVDRQIADRQPGNSDEQILQSIMLDYLLQEAAGARLEANGRADPLAIHQDAESSRSALRAAETLKRHGVSAHAIFDRANEADIAAIASGRFDQISQDHTRFAVSSQLRLSATAMAAETMRPAQQDAAPSRDYPGRGLAKGPQKNIALVSAFGRKNGAER